MSPCPVTSCMKALLLGFLCCLGVSSAADQEMTDKQIKVELLSLHEVHRDSTALVGKIQTDEANLPEGYSLVEMRDQKEGQLILSKHQIVGTKDVALARPTNQVGEIAVRLTEEGGKRMEAATRKMEIGRTRMAVVLKGKVIIAPIVQAKLGRDFVINGLDGKDEVKQVVRALNAPK